MIELGANDIVTILQGTSDGKHQVRTEVLEEKNAFAGVRNGSVVLQYTQPGTIIKVRTLASFMDAHVQCSI